LLYSSRTLEDVIYREELIGADDDGRVDVRLALTRQQPEGWLGYGRRIDAEMLAEVAWSHRERPQIYVCGPTAFVEVAANSLVELGHDMESIRTERFGPTGT
jgi:ferredoxin-NADP reductase